MEQWLWGPALGSLFLLLALYLYRDKVIYMPVPLLGGALLPSDNAAGYRSPAERGLLCEDLYVPAKDGTKLHIWLLRAKTKAPLVLYLSGNVGNVGLRLDLLEEMYRKLGCHLAVLSYRGYGQSQGTPSEAAIKSDVKDLLCYLRELPDLPVQAAFLYGEQLGGAVALSTALQCPDIAGVILENPFISVKEVLRDLFPYLSWLLFVFNGCWDSSELISQVKCPLFFLIGQSDETIPNAQSYALQRLASVPYRQLLVPTGNNCTTWRQAGPSLWPALSTFFALYQ